VAGVSVDLAGGFAWVDYNPGETDVAQMRAAVEAQGYNLPD
jgi:hypothetical protein